MTTDRPLTPDDLALLTTERHGQAIVRLRGDVGGGDSSPFNYGLWCGSCDALLGRLGIFRPRASDAHVPYPHRIAHCARCHATTFVREDAGRARVERLDRKPMGTSCWLCPTPAKRASVDLPEAERGDTVGIVSGEELVRKNARKP